MFCNVCAKEYSESLVSCPQCTSRETGKQGSRRKREGEAGARRRAKSRPAENEPDATAGLPAVPSTLVEFPGSARSGQPPWRRELSEKVRIIQQRRALEAAREAEAAGFCDVESDSYHSGGARLGLVSSKPHDSQPNPIVVAALKRIERARRPPSSAGSWVRGTGTATAHAFLEAQDRFEEAPEVLLQVLPPLEQVETVELAERVAELVAVDEGIEVDEEEATPQLPGIGTIQISTAVEVVEPIEISEPVSEEISAEPLPRSLEPEVTSPEGELENQRGEPFKAKVHRSVLIDDSYLTRLEQQILPPTVPFYEREDNHAPLARRIAAAIVDLIVVAFAASPFASIIELENGNWSDPKVLGCMGLIFLVTMFLYFVLSTALAGRTWGMCLTALAVIDAKTHRAPSFGQAMGRAALYMTSLGTLGLGVVYALFDHEHRTAHDHFSGTIVVQD